MYLLTSHTFPVIKAFNLFVTTQTHTHTHTYKYSLFDVVRRSNIFSCYTSFFLRTVFQDSWKKLNFDFHIVLSIRMSQAA
jgi:hypothetical protein